VRRFFPCFVILTCSCGGSLVTPESDGGDASKGGGQSDVASSPDAGPEDAGPSYDVVGSVDAGLLFECSGSTCNTCFFQVADGGLCGIVPAGNGGQYGGAYCSPEDAGDLCSYYTCHDDADGGSAQMTYYSSVMYCPPEYKDGGALGPDGALGYSLPELWDDGGGDASAECVRAPQFDSLCVSASSQGYQPLGTPYAYACPTAVYPSIPAGCTLMNPGVGSSSGVFPACCPD
jgi:hypothetical protein